MKESYDLDRFVEAQENTYLTALDEIKRGRKQSHWMWFIFPQLYGLGFSAMAQRYAIKNLQEAEAYLRHPVLGPRLLSICGELLKLKSNDALQVMGSPDDLKLRSSMTLFNNVPERDPVFAAVLNKYFGGKADAKTNQLLS